MTSVESSLILPNMRRDEPLAPFTTLGIGGPAKYFFEATSVDELRDAVSWSAAYRHPLFVLSGGSNVLISDLGYDGLVIHIALRGITVESIDEFATVRVAAGEPWDDFVAFAVTNGWAGVECPADVLTVCTDVLDRRGTGRSRNPGQTLHPRQHRFGKPPPQIKLPVGLNQIGALRVELLRHAVE